jgi:peptidoglycan/LPS O-acetylase OafA/YrhL
VPNRNFPSALGKANVYPRRAIFREQCRRVDPKTHGAGRHWNFLRRHGITTRQTADANEPALIIVRISNWHLAQVQMLPSTGPVSALSASACAWRTQPLKVWEKGLSGAFVDHQNNRRFDVTRGVAAIVVLIAHTAEVYGAGSWAEMASSWAARFAVLAFFLLSGRLITASIASNIGRNGRFDPVDYLFSRVARLYPPLLFAVILVVAVVTIIHVFGLPGSNGTPLGTLRASGISFTLSELVKCLLLYDGLAVVDGPLWTLYIEVKLYIAAAGIAMLAFGHSPAVRLIGVALAAFVMWTGGSYHHVSFWFFAVIWCFGAFTNMQGARQPRIFVAVSAAVTLICYATSGHVDYIDNPAGTVVQAAGCAAIAYALLVRSWAEIDFPAWLVKTGDFSYTLYVSHFPILAFGLSLSLSIDASPWGAMLGAILSAAGAFLVAVVAAGPLEDTAAFKKVLKRLAAELSWAG